MDFLGFGALNFDRLFKVEAIARGDEEVTITDTSEAPGGSAANTIYALGRLGLQCGFFGAVGNDSEGWTVKKSFSDACVDTSGIVVRKDARTGVVVGLVDPDGERSLYVAPGANSTLSREDLDMNYLSRGKIVHLTSFVEDAQLELQRHVVDALSSAKKTGISFAPGSLYAKKGFEALSSIIQKSRVLFLNEEEAMLLTDMGYEEAALDFLSAGCEIVAVTLRERGCFLADSEGTFHIPPVDSDVVDTTGAGDAFCAGFLYGLTEGKSLKDCGKMGNYVASLCISEIGARSGLPDRRTLEKGMQKVH